MTTHKTLIFNTLWDASKFFEKRENIITKLPDLKLLDLSSCFFSTVDETLPLIYKEDGKPISFVYMDCFFVKDKKYYAWLKI